MRCVLALYDHRLAGIGLDRLEEDREGFPELHSSRHKMALVDNLTSLHGSRCIRIIGQKRAGLLVKSRRTISRARSTDSRGSSCNKRKDLQRSESDWWNVDYEGRPECADQDLKSKTADGHSLLLMCCGNVEVRCKAALRRDLGSANKIVLTNQG